MKTILYERHIKLGAKMVNFQGWDMPLYYRGALLEHRCVRTGVGLFDVSHMGRLVVEGKECAPFLEFLSSNKLSEKADLTATHTILCRENGSAVDNAVVYKHSKTRFSLIVNASNRKKVLEHLRCHSKNFEVRIAERYRPEGILSIQGPQAAKVVCKIFPQAHILSHMQFAGMGDTNNEVLLSRTGYTGEDGFKIFAPHDVTALLWDRFLEDGASEGIVPCGFGARDSLRLEMGYALYEHELNDETAAIESIAGWAVNWEKGNFLGRDALHKLADSRNRCFQYGVVLLGEGIAREGYEVGFAGEIIGKVTSGGFFPSLEKAIAIISVKERYSIGETLDIIIREKPVKAKIVDLPFFKERISGVQKNEKIYR